MSKRDDLKSAFECRQPAGAVRLWELEFHLWDQASGDHLVLGRELDSLGPAARERALWHNAEVIVSVSADLGFAAVNVPSGFWEQARGQLAYFVVPPEAQAEQIRRLHALAPSDLMLIANTEGVIDPPDGAGYTEFAYLLHDAPEQVEERARDITGGLSLPRAR